jgi:hypothetical protein
MKSITEKTYIKSDWNQGDASPATEELIDNHVLGSNPGDKCEHAQELGDCARLASLINLGGADAYCSRGTNTRRNYP